MHKVISVVSFDYNQPGLGEGGGYRSTKLSAGTALDT